MPRALHSSRGETGFTLIELVAVMAILAILAALVAGAVGGLGASGQSARLAADMDTIGKAADRFYNDAFPQAYPAEYDSALAALPRDGITIPTAVAPQVIVWDSRLPQDPTKNFVPGYLKDIPDSAALVSWRLDPRTASVFFADDAALLIPPSTAKLDVEASSTTKGIAASYTLTIRLNKYEAAQKVVTIAIPEGYDIAQPTSGQIGGISGAFLKDNPWNPGTPITYSGTVTATSDVSTWELTINFPIGATQSTFPVTYDIAVVRPAGDAPGKLTWDLTSARTTALYASYLTAPSWHSSSQTVVLTLASTLITNPETPKVYRWLTEEHTSIDVEKVFKAVAGMQSVVIKTPTPTATPTPTPTPVSTPTATATPTPTATPVPTVMSSVATVSLPASARMIAVDSVLHKAFIAVGDGFTSSTHFVSVIDGSTNSVTANIAQGDSSTGPTFVAVNETTHRVYVSHTGAYYASAIDGVANTVLATGIGAGTLSYPEGIGANPSTNFIYVANTNGASVSVIDGASNTVVQTLPVGGSNSNRYLTVIPATNRVYMTDNVGYQIVVINGRTSSLAASVNTTFSLGATAPTLITSNPTTNRLYVMVSGSSNLLVLDAATGATVASVPVGGSAITNVAVNPTTNRVYVTNGTNTLTVINGATNTIAETVSLPSGALGQNVGVDTSNGRVYVTTTSNSVMVLQD